MQHFVYDDGLNAFRLPVSWQYLVNGVLGGSLDPTNWAIYDKLVQACVSVAALCEIDIHNYARWNGKIIGQDVGAPTNAQFATFWGQLGEWKMLVDTLGGRPRSADRNIIAAKYANNPKIAFGVMNEPVRENKPMLTWMVPPTNAAKHDLNIPAWAATVQAAVTAIRNAGATSNLVLIPGSNYSSGAQLLDSGAAAALSAVRNPGGDTNNIIFDVHQYLDSDNSGTHPNCVTNNSACKVAYNFQRTFADPSLSSVQSPRYANGVPLRRLGTNE